MGSLWTEALAVPHRDRLEPLEEELVTYRAHAELAQGGRGLHRLDERGRRRRRERLALLAHAQFAQPAVAMPEGADGVRRVVWYRKDGTLRQRTEKQGVALP